MRCPICKRSVAWESNPFRPFCSERCELIDLGNWLEERYRVSTVVDTGEKAAAEGRIRDTKGERD